MTWVEDATWKLESLERDLRENIRNTQILTTIGQEVHKIVEQAHHNGDGSTLQTANGDGDTLRQVSHLYKRARELLIYTVISVVESFSQDGTETRCVLSAEEEMNAVTALLQGKGANSACEALATLHGRWRRLNAAARAGRWCEAHITLLSDDKPLLDNHGLYDLLPMSEWWWKPESLSSAGAPETVGVPNTNCSVGDVWLSFEDIFSTIRPSQCSDLGLHLCDTNAVLAFLDELSANTELFTHRIPCPREELRRFYSCEADVLFQQARLVARLSFLNGNVRNFRSAGGGPTITSRGVEGCYDILWVKRDGLSASMHYLIEAFTAAQIATMQFGASCSGLIHQIRLAMVGFGSVGGEKDTVLRNDRVPFLHPSVEPSSNMWRIRHGVGLIATNHIAEGTVVVKDRPLLFVNSEWQQGQKGERCHKSTNTSSAENATVVNRALELFFRGGLAHKDELSISHIVKALRSGRFIGDPLDSPDVYAALRLLAMMPTSGEREACADRCGTKEVVRDGEMVAKDVADLLTCWKRRSVVLQPAQHIRAIPKDAENTRCRALCPLVSLINHSCEPNAMLLPISNDWPEVGNSLGGRENSMCVIALRDIGPGEEIAVSYLPSLLIPRALKDEQNGFYCRCSFCVSNAALLEGVVCPECRQLIYNPEDGNQNGNECESSARCMFPWGVSTRPSAPGDPLFPMARRSHEHAGDCSRADSDGYEALSNRILQGYAEAVNEAACEFRSFGTCCSDGDDSNAMEGSAGTVEIRTCTQGVNIGEAKGVCENDGNSDARRDQLAQKALRRMMSLDSLAHGLPTTHHIRLQTRLECLELSLRSQMTIHDNHMLLLICEELLEDLNKLLPPNHPLLTGVRLQYALARSRHFTDSSADVHVAHNDGQGCCGGVRGCATTLSLPFLRDGTIRECVVRSFQEFFVSAGWRYEGRDQKELLDSFLREYTVELLMCGVESTEHMTLLSLLYDASQKASMGVQDLGGSTT